MVKAVWYIYTMEYYTAIKRNAFESFLVRWMNLEPVIQIEVRKKNKFCILMYIYGIQKNGTDEPICRARIETENRLWTQLGKKRVGPTDRVAMKHKHCHM